MIERTVYNENTRQTFSIFSCILTDTLNTLKGRAHRLMCSTFNLSNNFLYCCGTHSSDNLLSFFE